MVSWLLLLILTRKHIMRLLSIICVASAFLAPGAVAAPGDGPDTIYINGEPCGYFCRLFFNTPPPPAPEQSIPPEMARNVRRPVERSKFVDVRGRKQSRLAARLVPLPRARPLSETSHNPTQASLAKSIADAPADILHASPSAANPVIVAPPLANDGRIPPTVTLDGVDQLTSFLASEARREKSYDANPDPEITGTVRKDDRRVAVVIAKNEVQSIAELANKIVAIDGGLSQQDAAAIRTALVAAGASEVEMSGDQTKVIERMERNEVPAAIVGLVSRDAANSVPKIEGYQIFRVPLSPG